MKRYISMFILFYICFLLQTTVFAYFKISNVMPNLILLITSISGFMYGRRMGMFIGISSGLLIDLLYGEVIGISVLIYTVIGYLNGSVNKLYLKDDYVIPFTAMAVSDLLYGILFYLCHFFLRGRLHILFYLRSLMIPEMIYTFLIGILLYLLIKRLDTWIHPPQEISLASKQSVDQNR